MTNLLGENPANNPATWSLGYQARQFGVAGPSVLEGLANPPANMATAVTVTGDAYTTTTEPPADLPEE